DLRLEDRLVDLAGEGVDLAIRSGIDPPDSASLVARPLFSYRRRAVASPSYLSRRKPPERFSDLSAHELLFQGRGFFAQQEPRLRSNAPFAILAAAVAGAGIALLPEWMVAPEIEAGRLRALLPGWESEPVRVYALHR